MLIAEWKPGREGNQRIFWQMQIQTCPLDSSEDCTIQTLLFQSTAEIFETLVSLLKMVGQETPKQLSTFAEKVKVIFSYLTISGTSIDE